MRLLLAEDELAMAEAVADILTYHQYSVDTALRGDDALRMIQAGGYDGVILDVMMPGMDGLQVLARMRDQGMRTPVLLLTAKGEVEDKVKGFELGADDYLVKPFAMAELLVRVKALLRHGGAEGTLTRRMPAPGCVTGRPVLRAIVPTLEQAGIQSSWSCSSAIQGESTRPMTCLAVCGAWTPRQRSARFGYTYHILGRNWLPWAHRLPYGPNGAWAISWR